MKYIITESRMENLIFKYLDNKLDGVKKKKGKYCDIVFAFPGEEFGLIGWNSPDQLFTFVDLINDVKLMFSIERAYILDVIGRYVENRYNLKVSSNVNSLVALGKSLKVDN